MPSRCSQRFRAADLARLGRLFRRQVIEPEDEQGIAIGEDGLVDRLAEAGLVDALEDRDRMAGRRPRRGAGSSRSETWNSSSVPAMPWRKRSER